MKVWIIEREIEENGTRRTSIAAATLKGRERAEELKEELKQDFKNTVAYSVRFRVDSLDLTE
jgi:hypothetical protein